VSVSISSSDIPEVVPKFYNSTGAGIWSWKGEETCFYYPIELILDVPFTSARVFSTMASIFGGFTMISVWFATCTGMHPILWKTKSVWLALTTLFEGLTFLVFKSQTTCGSWSYLSLDYKSTCKLDAGAGVGIAAIILWFASAISIWNMKAPELPEHTMVKEVVTTVETISPDGTKHVETQREFFPVNI